MRISALVTGCDLAVPVNAEFERGYAVDPDEVGEIADAAEWGSSRGGRLYYV
ncbi:MAG: hypothetical protein M3237_13115 [Actinomycetota bacterium]|nr:hypothetical protein [Actinomycetota bacterium]